MEVEGKKFYDDDGAFHWAAESSEEEMSEQEEAEQEDSDSYSDALSGVWSDLGEQEAAAEAPTTTEKIGKRIAVTNLDWDNINATDLFVLFHSFCHSQGKGDIERVQVFPSLFGQEQMKRDSLYGPPKEMFNTRPVSKTRHRHRN